MCEGPPDLARRAFNDYGHRYRSSAYQGRAHVANYEQRSIVNEMMSSYKKK